MLFLANKLNYISDEQKNDLINKTEEISRIIKGLKNSMKPLTTNS